MAATATAGDIIRGALRLLQVLGDDVVLSSSELANGLEALNLMLDSWSNASLTIWQVEQEVFSLTAGHNPHTWGTGGDFDSLRPTRLLECKTRLPGNVDVGVRILGHDDYAAISFKSLSSSYPAYVYIDNAYPLANLYVWPVPTGVESLVIYSEKPHETPVTAESTLSFPPGYLRALKFNLAAELAPEYQVSAGADIAKIALDSLAEIKRTNQKPQTLGIDPALLGNRSGTDLFRGSSIVVNTGNP